MFSERVRSFADQLLEEPNGFRRAAPDFAARILRYMLSVNGKDDHFTVLSITTIIAYANPDDREELLMTAASHFKENGRWGEFVKALLIVARDEGEEADVFPTDRVREMLQDTDGFHALWACRDLVGDQNHPLFDWIRCDLHWQEQVRKRIAKGDMIRAWDDLRRAIGGWCSTQEHLSRITDPQESWKKMNEPLDRGARCLIASIPTCTALINELFAAMSERKLVSADTDEERYKYLYRSWATPGYSYALLFAQHVPPGQPRPSEYSMLLKMAEYFSKAKIERKRARRATA